MLPVAVQHILIKQIRKDALYRDVIRDKCSNQCKEDGRTCIVLRAFLFDDGVCIATGTKAFRMINIPYPHHALYDVHVNLNLVVSRFSLAVGVIYHALSSRNQVHTPPNLCKPEIPGAAWWHPESIVEH